MTASLLAEQLLNGIQFGVMLFLMSAGLTLVFGIMNLINLAHGSLYMVGAFGAATLYRATGQFVLSLVGATLGAALVGAVLERGLLRRFYRRQHLDQVLVTFGLILVFNELTRMIWGPVPVPLPLPEAVAGSITLLPGLVYPTFRLVILGVGLLIAAGLYGVIVHTRIGMWVRAGASDRAMAAAMGVDVDRVFVLVFAAGAGLAGLAGMMTGPLTAVQVGMGDPILILALVVTVIGGIGSVRGAFVAALLIGIVDTVGRILLPPALGSMMIFIVMAAILAWRPKGLFPVPGDVPEAPAAPARPVGSRPRVDPAWILVGLLALVPLVAKGLDDPFLIRVFTRVVVFAIAALALNLVLGFAGLVSLLHAGLVGVGGYVVAILAYHDANAEPLITWPITVAGTSDLAISLPLAMAASALVAGITGAISLRTSGPYFIMITLAFNQMLYYSFVALQTYGGDDGLQIQNGLTFLGRDVTGRTTFYWIALGVLAVVLLLLGRVVDSRFGIALRGAAQNARRLEALGIPPLRYRLVAFVISGAITGVAGALLATGQQFISPVDMSWVRSGDLVVMCVLGGLSTVWGPLAGAAAFLLLELVLEGWTTHWQLVFGLLIVAMVSLFRGGLADLWWLAAGWRETRARP